MEIHKVLVIIVCDLAVRTPTAFLKAKGGTAFKLYEEWRKLSYEEQCLWAMEGRWLNKENDEEQSRCLWASQLLLFIFLFLGL